MRFLHKEFLKQHIIKSIFLYIFNLDFLFLLFLVGIVVCFKYTTFSLPLHIDEMLYVGQAISVWKNNFNPFVWTPGAYHPPFFYEILALGYGIFGYSIFISHVINACLSIFCLYAVFKFLQYFVKNTVISIIITVSVFINPLYFTQTGLVQSDILLTGLMLFCIYFYFKKNNIYCILFGILCVFTKESGALFYSVLLIHFFISNALKHGLIKNIKKYIFFSIPVLLFIFWIFLNKILLGFYFDPVISNYFDMKNPILSNNFISIQKPVSSESIFEILKDIFWNFGNYNILFVFLFLLLLFLIKKRNSLSSMKKNEFSFIAFLFIVFLFFYSSTFFLIRYVLLLYIIIYIIIGFFFQNLPKIASLSIFVIWIFSINQIFFYSHSSIEKSGEINLSYIHIVQTNILAIKYIEENYSTKRILTAPTDFRKYIDPAYGYVSKSLLAFDNTSKYYLEGKFDLIVKQNYLAFNFLEELIANHGNRLHVIKRFESGPAVVEIYEYPRGK